MHFALVEANKFEYAQEILMASIELLATFTCASNGDLAIISNLQHFDHHIQNVCTMQTQLEADPNFGLLHPRPLRSTYDLLAKPSPTRY